MFIERFFSYFPPPDFLRMPYVGLDISDEAVRFVELAEDENGFVLKRFAERLIPEGAIEAGHVNSPGPVVEILKDLKREYGLSFVKAALPEEKVYLFKMEIPKTESEHIRSTIEFHLEENVPLSPSQAIFDYRVAQKDPHDEGAEVSTVDVSVSVLPQKVVETYLGLLTDAGLSVVSFETEGRAIRKAYVKDGDYGTYMVVNCTERKTGVFIISGGVVRFSSTIAIGGKALTETLAKNLSVSFEEARELKRGRGLINRDDTDIFAQSASTLAAIKDEINKVYTYWHTHDEKNKKIEKILLSGEDVNFGGFDKYLSLGLGVAVETGNPWVNVCDFRDHIPSIDAAKALAYAVPIGLSLS